MFKLLFRFLAKCPVVLVLGLAGIFGLSSFNSVDLHDPNVEDAVGLDLPVLIKLSIVGISLLYATYSIVVDKRVRHVFSTVQGGLLMLVCGFFLLTSLTAIQPIFAGVSALSIATAIVATISLAVRKGPLFAVLVIWTALATFLVFAWLMYLFVPSLGVFLEPVDGGRFVARMAGLAHPNVLGQYSGLAVLLAIAFLSTRWRSRIFLAIGISVIALGIPALILSMSRSSVLALLVALLVIFRGEFVKGHRIVWLGLAVVTTSSALLVTSMTTDLGQAIERRLAESVSKSGDAKELTSATGRTVIWSYAIKLISLRPLLGYGLTSSKSLLANYNSFTHNMVLNVALSSGVIAASALMFIILLQSLIVVIRPSFIADGLFVILVVNGLTENVMFEYIAAAPTALFALSVTWRNIERVRQES